MKKRILALFLCLTFIVSMFTGCGGNAEPKLDPNSALSSDELEMIKKADKKGTWGDNAEWYYKDGTLIVVGTGRFGMYAIDWEGDHNFKNVLDVTEIIIDEGITAIGDFSFYGFENVTNIKLPSTLESIGYAAFGNCKITEIFIPANVVKIESDAFEIFGYLRTVTIAVPDVDAIEIGDRAFGPYPDKVVDVITVKESRRLKEMFRYATFTYTEYFN